MGPIPVLLANYVELLMKELLIYSEHFYGSANIILRTFVIFYNYYKLHEMKFCLNKPFIQIGTGLGF